MAIVDIHQQGGRSRQITFVAQGLNVSISLQQNETVIIHFKLQAQLYGTCDDHVSQLNEGVQFNFVGFTGKELQDIENCETPLLGGGSI